MSDPEIDEIKKKKIQELSDGEVLELLRHEIDSRGKIPGVRDLRGEDSEWPVSENALDKAAGGLNNALWLLGEEPRLERRVVDGDTEIVEHELRGLEHELGRPPKKSEGKEVYGNYDEDFRQGSGMPYHSLEKKGLGVIEPEREDELVEMLFVEEKNPEALKRNNEAQSFREVRSDERASKPEIDLVSKAYLPWIDETAERRDEEDKLEFSGPLQAAVFELIAEEGLTQREIANKLDLEKSEIWGAYSDLRDEGLIESRYGGLEDEKASGRVTVLTDCGREVYEKNQHNEIFEGEDSLSVSEVSDPVDNEVEDFPEEFERARTEEILRLLGEGYDTQEEIAEELGFANNSALRIYIKELKEYGLVESSHGKGTWLTEDGEEFYEQRLDKEENKATSGEIMEDEVDNGKMTESSSGEIGNIETLADVYSTLGTEASIEVFELLNQGYSRKEIAEETGRTYASLQNYIDKYKELGWIETFRGKGTEVTETGEAFYQELLEDDSLIESVYDE